MTDIISPLNEFLDKRVELTRVTLAGFRSYIVISTSQVAYNTIIFTNYIERKIERDK